MQGNFEAIDMLVREIKQNTNFLGRFMYLGRRALVVIVVTGVILATKLIIG